LASPLFRPADLLFLDLLDFREKREETEQPQEKYLEFSPL